MLPYSLSAITCESTFIYRRWQNQPILEGTSETITSFNSCCRVCQRHPFVVLLFLFFLPPFLPKDCLGHLTYRGKRNTASLNGSSASTAVNKKARGEGIMQNQLVNRALDGLSQGGRRSGRAGRGWGGRGRGRGRGFR